MAEDGGKRTFARSNQWCTYGRNEVAIGISLTRALLIDDLVKMPLVVIL